LKEKKIIHDPILYSKKRHYSHYHVGEVVVRLVRQREQRISSSELFPERNALDDEKDLLLKNDDDFDEDHDDVDDDDDENLSNDVVDDEYSEIGYLQLILNQDSLSLKQKECCRGMMSLQFQMKDFDWR